MFPLQGAQVWSLVGELRYSCSAIETKKKDHVMFMNCLASAHLPPECRLLYAAAKSLQSYPTLCDPTDGSPPGSPVPGILQARTLEWVAISFSNAWKWKVKVKSLSRVQLLATPWAAAYQDWGHSKFFWGQVKQTVTVNMDTGSTRVLYQRQRSPCPGKSGRKMNHLNWTQKAK